MLIHADIDQARWYVVNSDNKNAMEHEVQDSLDRVQAYDGTGEAA